MTKSKYNAKGFYDENGDWWPSKGENKRWLELKVLESAGEITNLERQVPFNLVMKTVYRADFVYDEKTPDGSYAHIVEDYKGFETPVYRRKRKAMKVQHGIEIRETGARRTRKSKRSRKNKS
jgi:hypothetical protein